MHALPREDVRSVGSAKFAKFPVELLWCRRVQEGAGESWRQLERACTSMVDKHVVNVAVASPELILLYISFA